MLSNIWTLHQSRKMAEEQSQFISLGRTVIERISALNFEALDNPATGSWIMSRIKGSTDPNNLPPLKGEGLKSFASQSVILDKDTIEGARIYIEYYRGLRADADVKPAGAALPGTPALIEEFEASQPHIPLGDAGADIDLTVWADSFRTKMNDPIFRSKFLLAPSVNAVGTRVGLGARTDINVDDLILVRVLIEWQDRVFNMYLAKRMEALP